MKIKNQFHFNMILFSAILLVVSFFVIYSFQQVDFINRQEDLARNVELGASNLNFYWNSYLLENDLKNLVNWEVEYKSFSTNIAGLKPIDSEQLELVDDIRADQKHLLSIYDDLNSKAQRRKPVEVKGLDSEALNSSLTGMATFSKGIVSDSSQLSLLLDHHSDTMKLTHISLLLILLLVFGGYLFTNYILVNRRILKSLAELQKGTETIGTGNLDISLKEKRNDEIGDLSHAFNQMATNLKIVTASKSE
jgi:nitrate/nitrite-specific signal transduction histidine kinase